MPYFLGGNLMPLCPMSARVTRQLRMQPLTQAIMRSPGWTTVILALGIYLLFLMVLHDPSTSYDRTSRQHIFRLVALPLRDGEEKRLVEFTRRRIRVKETCKEWGAYTSKQNFLAMLHKNHGSKARKEINKDKGELSKSQLIRLWQLVKKRTHKYLFVDKHKKLSWCKVPKAASTSWVHTFLEMSGQYNVSKEDMAGKHALLRERYPNLQTEELKQALRATLKFMVVRHPFERILSAYRDKLEDYQRDLKDRGGFYYSIYGKKIVKAYRRDSGPGANYNQRMEPTFREFVQYLLDTDVEEYDEHWRPISILCSPCTVRYDVIAKMETLKEDADFILYHRGLLGNVNFDWVHKTDDYSTNTSSVAALYYSQLTPSEVKQLYYKYLTDFLMFEYDPKPYIKLAIKGSLSKPSGKDMWIGENEVGDGEEDEEEGEDQVDDNNNEEEEETETEDNPTWT